MCAKVLLDMIKYLPVIATVTGTFVNVVERQVVDGFLVIACVDRRSHKQYEKIGDGLLVVDCGDRRARAD